MPKIQQLSPHEAQKIAAGQVVERPANIVKELVENALDAGATAITLYIEDGGKKLIRIVDNGCGMDAQDAELCFIKHATSKIRSMDELDTIATFGFRGEALASIAAVAQVTLITNTTDTQDGLKLTVHDGKIQNKEPISAPVGTDIAVRNLFYNVPARQKFLKTRDTEWRHILQLFQACCLDYPGIHFTLFSETKKFLNCPPVQEHAQRFAQLWDHEISQHMITMEGMHADNTRVHGVISDHQTFRYDRNNIFVFVNNRWVKDFKLTNALIKGYMNVAPQGRYPSACILITVNPTQVDVNMHPRKEEVKFMHPRMIEQLIQKAVKEALERNLSAHIKQKVQLSPAHAIVQPAMQPSYTPFNFDTISEPLPLSASTYTSAEKQEEWPIQHSTQNNISFSSAHLSKISDNLPDTPVVQIESATHDQEHAEPLPPIAQESTYKLVGQLHKTYILLEHEEGLFVVDQHAAHERILYEQFAKRFADIATVNLLFPQIITLSHDDMHTIEPHLQILQQHGIAIEPFGANQLKVHATPVHIKHVSMQELIQGIIGWIHEPNLRTAASANQDEFTHMLHHKLRAQMACKAAVKAGDVLTHEQMQKLLDDLEQTENRLTCPHGRPTGWLLSLYDIEKKFKRKL